MSPAQIFCSYIYGAFVVVDAALEIGMKLAQTLLNTLNAFFDAVINLFKYVIDKTVAAILDEVRVLQKKLVDLIWDGYKDDKKSPFCSNLYKCNIFLQELTDESSLIASTLIKLGAVTREQIQFANQLISDYNNFKDTVCSFGFTFNFGLSYLKRYLNTFKGILEGFLDTIMSKKDDIRRLIQSYINKLIDTGIFDLMAKLRKFFNCVLEHTGVCADIESAQLAYNNALEFMHIEEDGAGGYRLNAEDSNRFLNACDSRLNAINNAKADLQRGIDALVNPSDIVAASKAFNLASNILPGGMSWTDFKEGNWKNNKMVKYFRLKKDQFMDAFFKTAEVPTGVSSNYVINGMTINDEKGIIHIELPNGYSRTIDMNDRASYRDFNLDSGETIIDEIVMTHPTEYYVNVNDSQDDDFAAMLTPDGQIISIRRAAFEMAEDPECDLAKHCREVFSMLRDGFVRADEVVQQW